MTRRLLIGATAVLLAGAAGAGWWLTRRPLTYEARARASAEEAPAPSLGPATGGGGGSDSDGGEEPDEEQPLTLPPEAPALIRTKTAPTPAFGGTENYLLVGVDRTRGRGWGRADSLVVVVFDDGTGHAGLVSIPRDLHVHVPGHGPARINATLRIATRTGQDPLALIDRVVTDTLAIPIEHVVVGDLSAFERTVDRLGGITVEVPCPIIDNFVDPRTETGRRRLAVRAGARPMDGVTAAMYVRSRHGRSDWDRARRQQAVLFALRDRVRSLGPTEWVPALSAALDEGVVTTMSRLEMIGLARRTSRLDHERIHGILLGRAHVTAHRTVEGRSVLLPDFEAIDRSLAELFEAPAPGLRPQRAQCPPADVAVR